MSESSASLKRKIGSATDLLAVVRTMKAMTAANIHQYESAVAALDDYYNTVQLGLMACFRQTEFSSSLDKEFLASKNEPRKLGILVFGSDQGLVGQFNESLAEFVLADLAEEQGDKIIWVAGERMQSHFEQSDLTLESSFALPKTIKSITSLVGEILLTMEASRAQGRINEVVLFHNQLEHTPAQSGSIYTHVKQDLLPLDAQWQRNLMDIAWPSSNLPEVANATTQENKGENFHKTLLALIHEYLFVSLYRACAESLASENASRLAAMQRAEKNIDDLLLKMSNNFHILRQNGIDAELFDVISGFNALDHG